MQTIYSGKFTKGKKITQNSQVCAHIAAGSQNASYINLHFQIKDMEINAKHFNTSKGIHCENTWFSLILLLQVNKGKQDNVQDVK